MELSDQDGDLYAKMLTEAFEEMRWRVQSSPESEAFLHQMCVRGTPIRICEQTKR